ncbi:hypothetical protein RIR_jg1107.t1 [Rhizophagus irregularis DAOM 181602=DAOM 197198]|nr:hypothetical protein RIR_jg1107.t1 [Rhizophagus irregularis DAOM 181602=DAOM 197198]
MKNKSIDLISAKTVSLSMPSKLLSIFLAHLVSFYFLSGLDVLVLFYDTLESSSCSSVNFLRHGSLEIL